MAGIGNVDTGLDRASGGVNGIGQVRDLALEALFGLGLDFHPRARTQRQAGQIVLEDVGQHPYMIEIHHGHHLGVAVDDLAHDQVTFDQGAGNR